MARTLGDIVDPKTLGDIHDFDQAAQDAELALIEAQKKVDALRDKVLARDLCDSHLELLAALEALPEEERTRGWQARLTRAFDFTPGFVSRTIRLLRARGFVTIFENGSYEVHPQPEEERGTLSFSKPTSANGRRPAPTCRPEVQS